jgi:hypothetical protein
MVAFSTKIENDPCAGTQRRRAQSTFELPEVVSFLDALGRLYLTAPQSGWKAHGAQRQA